MQEHRHEVKAVGMTWNKSNRKVYQSDILDYFLELNFPFQFLSWKIIRNSKPSDDALISGKFHIVKHGWGSFVEKFDHHLIIQSLPTRKIGSILPEERSDKRMPWDLSILICASNHVSLSLCFENIPWELANWRCKNNSIISAWTMLAFMSFTLGCCLRICSEKHGCDVPT